MSLIQPYIVGGIWTLLTLIGVIIYLLHLRKIAQNEAIKLEEAHQAKLEYELNLKANKRHQDEMEKMDSNISASVDPHDPWAGL